MKELLKKFWQGIIVILKRLKSPVVIGQIITNIAGIFILVMPDKADFIDALIIPILALVNLFAGLNNPSDKENF